MTLKLLLVLRCDKLGACSALIGNTKVNTYSAVQDSAVRENVKIFDVCRLQLESCMVSVLHVVFLGADAWLKHG